MSLEAKIMEQLKTALKAKDEAALRTLRSIKAAILEAKTAAGAQSELSAEDELRLLQKMAKQRKDSAAIFEDKGRNDLAEKEREELEVLQQFLPKALSEEELEAELRQLLAAHSIESKKEMGKAMAVANKVLMGKAEGSLIAKMVKGILK